MAFSTSTIQPASKPVAEKQTDNGSIAASLLSLLLLTAYGASKSRKALRKLKRRLLWNAFKLKIKSLFSKKDVSDRTLLLILLAVIVLALLLINVVVGLIVLLMILLLYLLGVFKI
jgi:hypothetical protein